jgi:hypothetical protein
MTTSATTQSHGAQQRDKSSRRHNYVPPRTEGSQQNPVFRSGRCSTMGKKSREKKAKQLKRDRKREEGEAAARVTSDEGGSSSSTAHHSRARVRVVGLVSATSSHLNGREGTRGAFDRSTGRYAVRLSDGKKISVKPGNLEPDPDHHHTPAAAAKPSTDDDTHDNDSASIAAVIASDSTAAMGEKLRAFCESCVERMGEDIISWVDSEFSGDLNAVKAAAERGDAKAQYALGFLMAFSDLPNDNGVEWLQKAAAQGYADASLAIGVGGVNGMVRNKCPQSQEKRFHNRAIEWLTRSAVEHNSDDAQYLVGMLDCWKQRCARSKPGSGARAAAASATGTMRRTRRLALTRTRTDGNVRGGCARGDAGGAKL